MSYDELQKKAEEEEEAALAEEEALRVSAHATNMTGLPTYKWQCWDGKKVSL